MTTESITFQQEQAKLNKKAYQCPRLLVYGNIHTLTQAVAMTPSAQADSGTGQTNKTH